MYEVRYLVVVRLMAPRTETSIVQGTGYDFYDRRPKSFLISEDMVGVRACWPRDYAYKLLSFVVYKSLRRIWTDEKQLDGSCHDDTDMGIL